MTKHYPGLVVAVVALVAVGAFVFFQQFYEPAYRMRPPSSPVVSAPVQDVESSVPVVKSFSYRKCQVDNDCPKVKCGTGVSKCPVYVCMQGVCALQRDKV